MWLEIMVTVVKEMDRHSGGEQWNGPYLLKGPGNTYLNKWHVNWDSKSDKKSVM